MNKLVIPTKSNMLRPEQRKRKARDSKPVKDALSADQRDAMYAHLLAEADAGLKKGQLAPMRLLVDFCIQVYAGTRVSTAHLLRVEDVYLSGQKDAKKDRLTLHAKGGKSWQVPIDPRLAEVLEVWLTILPKIKCPETKQRWLLPVLMQDRKGWNGKTVARRGETIGDDSVRVAITKAGKAVGIPFHVTNHTLRRTCATNWYRNGMDLRQIQMLLGHSSIQTTTRYIQISFDELADAVGSAMHALPADRV